MKKYATLLTSNVYLINSQNRKRHELFSTNQSKHGQKGRAKKSE